MASLGAGGCLRSALRGCGDGPRAAGRGCRAWVPQPGSVHGRRLGLAPQLHAPRRAPRAPLPQSTSACAATLPTIWPACTTWLSVSGAAAPLHSCSARAQRVLAGRSSGGGVPTSCSQLRPSPPPLPTLLLPLADIGSSNPIQVDGKTVWVSTNQLCRRWAGQLGSRKGELVVLGCAVPLSGRYVGIEIECVRGPAGPAGPAAWVQGGAGTCLAPAALGETAALHASLPAAPGCLPTPVHPQFTTHHLPPPLAARAQVPGHPRRAQHGGGAAELEPGVGRLPRRPGGAGKAQRVPGPARVRTAVSGAGAALGCVAPSSAVRGGAGGVHPLSPQNQRPTANPQPTPPCHPRHARLQRRAPGVVGGHRRSGHR